MDRLTRLCALTPSRKFHYESANAPPHFEPHDCTTMSGSTHEPSCTRSAADDSRWFLEEVHSHDRQLKGYVRGLFPALHDVEDVVQESYLRMWKARATHRVACAKAFLFRVARNLAVDSARRESRSPITTLPEPERATLLDPASGVRDIVSTNEELRILGEAIDALPPRCREVIVLRQVEGLSQKEIAAKLGLSELTVQTHVVNGLRRLEAIMRRKGLDTKGGARG